MAKRQSSLSISHYCGGDFPIHHTGLVEIQVAEQYQRREPTKITKSTNLYPCYYFRRRITWLPLKNA